MTLTADIIAAIVKADEEAPVMGQVLDPGETVTFRVAGKQGEPGPEGRVGPVGPQGKRGFDGDIGVMGPQGVEGPIGPQGVPGTDGKDGAKGLKGDTGAIGASGLKGDKGDKGDRGPSGSVVMTRGGGAGGGGGGAALSDAVPLVESGAGAAGAAGAASRGDHVHPAGAGAGTQDLAEVLAEGNFVGDELIRGDPDGGDGASLELERGDGSTGGGTGYLRGGDGPEDGGDAVVKGGQGTDSGTYGVSGIAGEILAGGAGPGNGGLVRLIAGYEPVTSNSGGAVQANGGTASEGGNAYFQAGAAGTVGLPGGNAFFSGGSARNSDDAPGRFDAFGGDGLGADGKVGVTSAGSTGDAGDVLTADGAGKATWEPATGGGAPADATYLVTTAHAGLSAEVVVTAAGLALLDDANAAAQRTTLDVPSNAEAVLDTIFAAKGDILTATANDTPAILPLGATDGHVLTKDAAEATGMKWAAAAGGSGIAATIVDAKGDLIAATAADTVARLAVGTNGQVLAAASAATPGVRWDPNPGRPPFRSGAGFYYSSPFVAGGLTNLVQDTEYAVPFYVPYDITTSSINIATGGVASTSARLGIRADDTGKPGALIVEAGTIATTAAGHKTIALAQALTAGWIWLSGAVQGGAGQWFCGGNNGPSGLVAVYTPYAAASVGGYKHTGVSGALPSPWGATFTEQTQIPIVWLAF